MLKVILGLIKKTKGKVSVLGLDVDNHIETIRSKVGYMPQREYISATVPMRVKDVILMSRVIRKGFLSITSKMDIHKCKEALRMVGLEHLWDVPFRSLSVGQQQRVMLARALAVDPEVLILDEPFSGVDVAAEKSLIQLLFKIRRDENKSIILVTHDISLPYSCSEYVLLLKRKMIAFGPPSEVITDENMMRMYGIMIKVTKMEGTCYILERDRHV